MNSSKNADPVFGSIGDALHTAFYMECTELTTKGSTQILIEDMLKQRYGETPLPQSERGINPGSLTPLEMRGQCAQIRKHVDDLIEGERYAICARFGLHWARKSFGVHNLRDYFKGQCNTSNTEAILALLWAIYDRGVRPRAGETPQAFNLRRKQRENEWSLRGIARSYGVGKDVLHRDQMMLRKKCVGLEVLAQNKLEEVFVSIGLVGELCYAA